MLSEAMELLHLMRARMEGRDARCDDLRTVARWQAEFLKVIHDLTTDALRREAVALAALEDAGEGVVAEDLRRSRRSSLAAALAWAGHLPDPIMPPTCALRAGDSVTSRERASAC